MNEHFEGREKRLKKHFVDEEERITWNCGQILYEGITLQITTT